MSKPRILFIIDKGFAFKIIAEQVAQHLSSLYECHILSDRNPAASILRHHYDVVHLLAWDRWLRAYPDLSLSSKKTKAKLVAGIHSYRSWGEQWQEDVAALDALTVTCEDLQQVFLKSGKPTYLLPNGVDVDLFTPAKSPPKEFTIGYIGTRDAIKGFDEFIVPLAQELEVKLITNEKRLPYGPRLAKLYRHMSCYVCASESEGFCMPLIEAAASGVPAISTRVGVAETFIEHGVSGLLIERDYHAMKEAILHLISHPSLHQSMRLKARQYSLRYRWECIAQCYHVLYQKVLGGSYD